MSKIKIETRDEGTFLVTGKTHQGNMIVVNLDAIVKSAEVQYYSSGGFTKSEALWLLKYENDKLFLSLYMETLPEDITISQELDINIFAEEMSNCVIKNIGIDSCKYLNESINNIYSTAFMRHVRSLPFISNIPVNMFCEILDNNDNVIGRASRVVFEEQKTVSILEYAGKNPCVEDELKARKIAIYHSTNPYVFRFTISSIQIDENLREGLNYFRFRGVYLSKKVRETDLPEMKRLQNVPLKLSNPFEMKEYVYAHNDEQEIASYIASMKPRSILIDINKFMLDEFNK